MCLTNLLPSFGFKKRILTTSNGKKEQNPAQVISGWIKGKNNKSFKNKPGDL